MRIVHVTPYFPPDRVGGVGEVVAQLHKALLERGHDSLVITSGTAEGDPTVVMLGTTPVRFAFRCVAAVTLLKNADVVHVHHGEALLLMALARLRPARPAILLTLHVSNRLVGQSNRSIRVGGTRIWDGFDAWSQTYLKAPVKSVLDRVAMMFADRVSFVSRAGAMEVLGASRGSTASVIHNGVLDSPSQAVGTLVEGTELLYIGTANHRKRIGLLPHVLYQVDRSVPGARLRIVGVAGPRRRALAERFRDLGLGDQVIWEGEVSGDLAEFYRASDVLLVPSAYEGMPMVILEAMTLGVAVVATRVGGVEEVVVNGETGLLVPRDDVVAMAEACVQIISGRGGEFGRAGQRRARAEFGVGLQVTEYIDLYSDVAHRPIGIKRGRGT